MSANPARHDPQLPLLDPAVASPEFSVRVSARSRRLTVRVYPGGRVEVTVPRGTGSRAVERFVAEHRRWIDARVLELRSLKRARQPTLPEEVRLPALGQSWGVHYVKRLRPGWRAVNDGVLEIYGNPDNMDRARTSLRAWLTETARSALEPRLRSLAAERGYEVSGVQLRRQHTRWGSCSRAGSISLNVCLLFQTGAVVRYLMLHELCHTREMNHSPRFWRLLEAEEPAWRELDAELTRGWQHVPDWVYA